MPIPRMVLLSRSRHMPTCPSHSPPTALSRDGSRLEALISEPVSPTVSSRSAAGLARIRQGCTMPGQESVMHRTQVAEPVTPDGPLRSLGSRTDRPVVTGLIALLAALGFVLALWPIWAHGKRGRFILVGHHFASAPQLPHGRPVAPTYGYDGQFFYRLALSPLNFHHTAYGITMDRPYRYMRIGYPAVTWLFSLGQHAAV